LKLYGCFETLTSNSIGVEKLCFDLIFSRNKRQEYLYGVILENVFMTHDLIIVGGGPAGSSCARRAAQLGLDVLVLEKAHHPRRKPCAGGITPRVKDLLDFDISSVVEREQCGINLYSPSMVLTRIARVEAIGYTVRREDFDHFLLKKAEEAGAIVQQGVRATDVIEEPNGVRVVA
jgi:flavin-dependent dehydrogenase